MDSRWEKGLGKPSKVIIQRQAGITDGLPEPQFEFNRRPRENVAEAVAAAPVPTPAARVVAASPAQPLPPAPPAPLDLRFHKWAPGYVLVAKPHLFGEDPVVLPAYSDSIVAGYTKAAQLATRDGKRVSLIVVGGGGAFQEDVNLSHPLVDLFGWGNPVVEGALTYTTQSSPVVDGITFHSPNANPCFHLPFFGAPIVDPLNVPRISRCSFYGTEQVFLSERMVRMHACDFWHELKADGTFSTQEVAPASFVMETPQRWWSTLKDCRLYSGLAQSTPGANGVPMTTTGYAITARSGPLGTAPAPNLISFDGVFRTSAGAGASGALQSGVLLDHCEIYGAARIQDWTLAHEHCLIYGGQDIPERSGDAYAIMSGHDWISAGSFSGRQFSVALFDACNVHSTLIAYGISDPNTVSALFTGGCEVFFRNSQHLTRFDGAAAAAVRAAGTTKMDVNTVMSATPCATWGVGAGINLSDTGSQVSVTQNWHPLFV